MTLFADGPAQSGPRRERGDEGGDATPLGRRRPSRRLIGAALIAAAVICAGVVSALPAPYVIETPGPTFDVLGDTTVSGEQVPMISIPSGQTYATAGSLRVLTVYVNGPEQHPTWLEVVSAYLDRKDAVVPEKEVYPPGYTQQDNADESALEMTNSQNEAIAAALGELGYQLDPTVTVYSLTDDSAAAGILQPGDRIRSANGVTLTSVDQLRDEIAKAGTGTPVTLAIVRDGVEQTVSVTPRTSSTDGTTPVIGILGESGYAFPFDVKIQLEDVGGPSGGMMFALGVYDKLTDGALTGGQDIAGTGTIDANGEVGAIGGIRQKLWGAQEAGARYFLAPAANCDQVVGHVPDGLTVTKVSTLDEAIHAVEVIGAGGDVASLPVCD